MQHDLSPLHHSAPAPTPDRAILFELRSIVVSDLNALRQSRHTEPPSSLDTTSNRFSKAYEIPCNHPRTKRTID